MSKIDDYDYYATSRTGDDHENDSRSLCSLSSSSFSSSSSLLSSSACFSWSCDKGAVSTPKESDMPRTSTENRIVLRVPNKEDGTGENERSHPRRSDGHRGRDGEDRSSSNRKKKKNEERARKEDDEDDDIDDNKGSRRGGTRRRRSHHRCSDRERRRRREKHDRRRRREEGKEDNGDECDGRLSHSGSRQSDGEWDQSNSEERCMSRKKRRRREDKNHHSRRGENSASSNEERNGRRRERKRKEKEHQTRRRKNRTHSEPRVQHPPDREERAEKVGPSSKSLALVVAETNSIIDSEEGHNERDAHILNLFDSEANTSAVNKSHRSPGRIPRSGGGRSFMSVTRSIKSLHKAQQERGDEADFMIENGPPTDDGDEPGLKMLTAGDNQQPDSREGDISSDGAGRVCRTDVSSLNSIQDSTGRMGEQSHFDFCEIDFIHAVRKALQKQRVKSDRSIPFYFVDSLFSKYDNTTEIECARILLDRQKELNIQTKEDPSDIAAWMELASLSHHSGVLDALGTKSNDHDKKETATQVKATSSERSRRKDSTREQKKLESARRSDMERKREILTRAIQYNPDDIDLRCSLLQCLDELRQAAAVDEEKVEQEYRDAISHFESLSVRGWEQPISSVNASDSSEAGSYDTETIKAVGSNVPQTHQCALQQSSTPPTGRGRGISNLPAWMTLSNVPPEQPGHPPIPQAVEMVAAGRGKSINPTSMNYASQGAACIDFQTVPGRAHMRASATVFPKRLNSLYPDLTHAKSLLRLHRMKLRRLPRRDPSTFNAENVRHAFINAFRSLSSVYSTNEGSAAGPEMAFLFLDYLRMESMMGYSERAVGLIQAALEFTLRPTLMNTEMQPVEESFRDFWDSEASRIGDEYSNAGWHKWEEKKKESPFVPKHAASAPEECTNLPSMISQGENPEQAREIRKKRKKRLKASDFFDLPAASDTLEKGNIAEATPVSSEERLSSEKNAKLVGAYEAAMKLETTTSVTVDDKKDGQEQFDALDKILQMAGRGQSKSARNSENGDGDYNTQNNDELHLKDQSSPTSTKLAVDKLIELGQVAPSQVRSATDNVVSVYSFVHNRRIEISKEELCCDSTRNTLRRVFQNLKNKRKEKSRAGVGQNNVSLQSRESVKATGDKIYDVGASDPFLLWAKKEYVTQGIFCLPLRSQKDPDAVTEDPNRTVLYEDGVGDIVVSNFHSFDRACGLPALVVTCLQFLGISFPRSTAFDVFEKNTSVLAANGSGGECINDVVKGNDCLGLCLDSVFDIAMSSSPPSFCWDLIHKQILIDESIVSFDPTLFEPGQEKQMVFVRNILHDMVSTFEGLCSPQTSLWSVYVSVALILFETEAAHVNAEQARSVSRSLLAGTKAASHDPRIWLAYAQLETKFIETESSKKQTNAVSKLLLSALDATQTRSLHEEHAEGWMELCLLVVRIIVEFPWSRHSVFHLCQWHDMSTESSEFDDRGVRTTPDARDKALHVLCCAIEGSYSPMPKKRKKKSKGEEMVGHGDETKRRLVSATRMLKCQNMLGKHLSALGTAEEQKKKERPLQHADFFDPTPVIFYYGAMAAWLEVLNPTNCSSGCLNFYAGIDSLDLWMEKACSEQHARGNVCLAKWSNMKLEFSVASMSASSDLSWGSSSHSFRMLKDVLVPTAVLLKMNGCVPSKSILLAIALMESQLDHIISRTDGYFSICANSRQEPSGTEILFFLARTVLSVESELPTGRKNCTELSTYDFPMLCSCWTPTACDKIREAIHRILNFSGSYVNPTLWDVLIRLELLGGINSRDNKKSYSRRKFISARCEHERGLTSCIHSKRLWLDAFTVLRPVISETQMMAKLAALEEADIRLVQSVEDMEFS